MQRHKAILRAVLTALLALGVSVAFWRFIGDNTQRIGRQNEEYLNELTSQRVISIDSLISENLTFIQSTAYLYGQSLETPWADVAVIRDYERNSSFDMLRFVDEHGDDYTSEGVKANLADREYFQRGMRGESGVTYVLHSRVTGERQIGFFAPVYFEDQIVGVMVGFYGEDYVSRLLEYELFGYEGEGWLCTRDGVVLGSTMDEDFDDFFAYLREEGGCGEAELGRVREAFAHDDKMAFTYRHAGERATGYAIGLANVDWVLVRNFPPEASGQILYNANSEGIELIMELVVMFGIYGLYLIVSFLIEQRRMREANRDANDISTGAFSLFSKFIVVDVADKTYRYIGRMSDVPNLAPEGPYAAFCEAVLQHIPDERQRAAADEFMGLAYLTERLADAETASIRLYVPLTANDEWFTYNYVVLEREEGKPTRLLVVRQDVTDLHRKEEEEQRRLQDALDVAERASHAKTEFLFNMSHDIRTPMNAIIGYTELAQREGVTPDEMREYIRKIDSSSAHLLALINDILEMSRIESGKLTLEAEDTDLVATMDETHELFATQMSTKDIEFVTDASGVRDRWVYCDRNRLNRIVLNLLSNAYKFTPEHGTVRVTLAQVATEGGMGTYELRVRDTGIGMKPEFVKRLFTAFERERTSTVSRTQGTGLGLSITKSIVDLMGGTIDVHTEPGRGTEFVVRVSFPLITQLEEHAEVGPEPSQTVDFSTKRLLLVEDNEINVEIAQIILSEEGFEVETAENGQVAVDKVAAAEPGYYDAVLMDIQMPVMNGYEATRAIRALDDPVRASVPIVAMTANAFAEDVRESYEAGMNAHLAKPLDVPKMLATLADVLAGSNKE